MAMTKDKMEKFLLDLVDTYQKAKGYVISDTSGDISGDESFLDDACEIYRKEIKEYFAQPTIAVSGSTLETYESCKAQYERQAPLIKALPLKDDSDFIERMCTATDILSGRIMHRRG